MPAALTIRLRAERPFRPDTRQLHGLACALFEGEGSDGHQARFAVWPLRPFAGETDATGSAGAGHAAAGPAGPATGDVAESQAWDLQAAWLPDGPVPAAAASAADVRLGHVRCRVTETAQRLVPLRELASGPPASIVQVAFCSPCYFAHNGSDVITPEPRLIIGSWRRRWNASLPAGGGLMVSDDTWREILGSAHLTEFDLRTERRDSGHGRERSGFTGTATLALGREAPGRARRALGVLARFAGFCGTGAQVTHGFGATRTCIPGRSVNG